MRQPFRARRSAPGLSAVEQRWIPRGGVRVVDFAAPYPSSWSDASWGLAEPLRLLHPAYLVLAAALALAGCGERVGEYLPVSAIARGGFVGDERTVAEVHGRDVRLWGFVDHGNLYGDAEAASGSDGGFMKNSG